VTSIFSSRRFRRLALVLVLLPLLCWAAAVAYIWTRQDKILFFPEPLAQNHAFQEADTQEEWVNVPGARLHALHLRQPMVNGQRHTRGIVFYLHGNAGNVATWFTNADFWRRSGYDLFMLDYRGYGKSSGHMEDEAQMHDDVLRAWQQVAPEYEGLKHVIFGRSLGTGLATYLATQVPTDLLLLVSPYTSIEAMAQAHYPWVPGAVLRYPLHTDRWLPNVKAKVVIFHGERDTLIPIDNAERLQALKPQALLIRIPQAGHGDIHQLPAYTDALMAQLQGL